MAQTKVKPAAKTASKTAAEKAAKVTVKKAVTPPAPAEPSEPAFAHELARLRDDIDRTFERFFRGWPEWPRLPRLFEPDMFREMWEPMALPRFELRPRVDVSENEKAYEISAELPGIDEKDVNVTLSDDMLTIKGEKKSEREEKKKDYHRLERRFGSFQRTFPLPDDVDVDKIGASFKKGVLSVTLPKLPVGKSKRRKIEIEAK